MSWLILVYMLTLSDGSPAQAYLFFPPNTPCNADVAAAHEQEARDQVGAPTQPGYQFGCSYGGFHL